MNALIFSSILFFAPVQQRDSLGTETVNGQVFVIHSVGERETLYGISRRYGASIENILKYNPKADTGLEIGQILKIPYTAKKVQATGAGTTHTVAAKETMYSISRMYGVTVDDIKNWNGLKDNTLSIGQQLVIKKGGATPVTTSTPAASTPASTSSKNGIHTVAAKETMFSISRQYGITVQQLRDWNKLETNDIHIGQELIISESATGNNVVATNTPSPTRTSATTESAATTPPASTANTQTSTTTPSNSQPPVTQTSTQTPAQETTVTPPVASKPDAKEQTIRITESVKNTNEVLQSGLAELIEGTSGNRKYLALHRTAPIGTIMKVRNEMNNREVFVRVMGKLPDTAVNEKLVIKISKSAYDRLGAIDPRFRVEVTYYK